jgi:RNA polymerase sigma-70 factor (sigma-E family)
VGPSLDFEAFCHSEYVRLIRMLTLYCGNPEVARDVTQEALARTCSEWRRVKRMGSPKAWLNRVAINLANSHFRRRAAERRATDRYQAREEPVHRDPDAATGVAVRQALGRLSSRQRTALLLRYFADLSVDETADAMRCGPGTVKKLARRGIDALRRELGTEITLEVGDGS